MNSLGIVTKLCAAVYLFGLFGCSEKVSVAQTDIEKSEVSYKRPVWKERESFVLKGPFDLSEARYFSFDLQCSDASAVNRGSCYFITDSKGSCYALPFEVNKDGKSRIKVDKADCSRVEGTPAGWGNVQSVKVSIWFDGVAQAKCAVSNAKVEPATEATVVIVSVEKNSEQCQWRQRLARSFDAIGLQTRIVSATDLSEKSLDGALLVAIPGRPAPKLPDAAVSLINRFKGKGGAVFSRPWKGLIPGEDADVFAGMISRLVPKLKPVIDQNTSERHAAALKAKERIASMKGKKGEVRRMCVHDEFGPCIDGGWDWDRAAAFLSSNGFTVLEANLCRGGIAFYDSKVLPVSTNIVTKGDQLKACLKACRKYGLELRVWRVCLNSRPPRYATPEFISWMKSGLAQISYSGKASERYLCPTAPENRRREIDAMVELASKGVDSVSFDYIRYPDRSHCFCNRCRIAFESQYGVVANWPKSIKEDPAVAEKWSCFKNETISSIVQETAKRIRSKYPKVKICAAVMGDADGLVKDLGQPWGLWARQGWIDVLMPMNYVTDPELLRQMLQRQKEVVPVEMLEPTIGPTLWTDDGANADLFAKQIEVVREEGFAGFGVFQLDYRTARDLPILRSGILK